MHFNEADILSPQSRVTQSNYSVFITIIAALPYTNIILKSDILFFFGLIP